MHVLGQVLGHLLGQDGDQGPVALGRSLADLVDDVVHLGEAVLRHGPDLHGRVDQARGPDHLLGEDAPGLLHLPGAGRRRDADRRRSHGVPFLELEGAVVHAGGQAEAIVRQGELAAEVTPEHGPDLGDGLVALVHEEQGVVRDVLEEGGRRLARLAAGQVAGIVLDAGAGAGGLDHLEVEGRPLLQPLGLQQLAIGHQPVEAFLKLGPDVVHGLVQGRPGRDVVAVGVDLHRRQVRAALAGQGVELGDGLDLFAKQADPPGPVLVVGREDFQGVAPAAEGSPLKGLVIAPVLLGDEVGHQLLLVDPVADLQAEGHGGVGLHRTNAVDAGDRGHDDDIVPLQDRPRGRVPHAVDLFVNRGVLLDVGVGPRHVGLGLVVVVVGDEELHGIVREEAPELAVELGRQGLVGRQDQGRTLGRLDHLGHGEGLARSRYTQEDLVALLRRKAGDKLGDGCWLVSCRGIVRDKAERPATLRLLGPVRPVRPPGHVRCSGVEGEDRHGVADSGGDSGRDSGRGAGRHGDRLGGRWGWRQSARAESQRFRFAFSAAA